MLYWGTDYDWRKTEAKLNALPQLMTSIDGLDFHYIHVRSRQPNALPLLIAPRMAGIVLWARRIDRPAHRSNGVRRDIAPGGHHGISGGVRAPETWARRAYRNLIYFNEVDRGGHFAAWEQPELFAEEIRAAFRSLRSSI